MKHTDPTKNIMSTFFSFSVWWSLMLLQFFLINFDSLKCDTSLFLSCNFLYLDVNILVRRKRQLKRINSDNHLIKCLWGLWCVSGYCISQLYTKSQGVRCFKIFMSILNLLFAFCIHLLSSSMHFGNMHRSNWKIFKLHKSRNWAQNRLSQLNGKKRKSIE